MEYMINFSATSPVHPNEDKELVNEDDLLISFERQKKEYGEKCTDPLVDMLSSDEPLDIDALEKMAIQTNKCLNVFFVKERNNK